MDSTHNTPTGISGAHTGTQAGTTGDTTGTASTGAPARSGWTPQAPWAPGSYTYVSGARSMTVWDGASRSGGHMASLYVGCDGDMPPFQDGTPVRFAPCDACRSYAAVMQVPARLLGIVPGKRWLCVDCCPPESLPR